MNPSSSVSCLCDLEPESAASQSHGFFIRNRRGMWYIGWWRGWNAIMYVNHFTQGLPQSCATDVGRYYTPWKQCAETARKRWHQSPTESSFILVNSLKFSNLKQVTLEAFIAGKDYFPWKWLLENGSSCVELTRPIFKTAVMLWV